MLDAALKGKKDLLAIQSEAKAAAAELKSLQEFKKKANKAVNAAYARADAAERDVKKDSAILAEALARVEKANKHVASISTTPKPQFTKVPKSPVAKDTRNVIPKGSYVIENVHHHLYHKVNPFHGIKNGKPVLKWS